jgi:hypothetical protein
MPDKKITGLELGLRLFTTPPSNCTIPAKITEPDMSAFLLKEYKTLKGDMLEAVKETRELERWAVAVVGGIWSWLVATKFEHAVQETSVLIKFAWFLPFILVGFLFWRAWALTRYIDYLGKYLGKVEEAFIKGEKDASGEVLGFEKRWRPSEECTFKRRTFWWFWRGLIVVTFIFPALLLIFPCFSKV